MDDDGIEAPPPGAFAHQAFLMAAQLNQMETISRATSPGLPFSNNGPSDKSRYRPRTFAYFSLLPFEVEPENTRQEALAGILKELYITIKAEDFSPGAVHWTRELTAWLSLKFELPRELRATLAKLYYHLSLAPGLDSGTADRFARMLICLTK